MGCAGSWRGLARGLLPLPLPGSGQDRGVGVQLPVGRARSPARSGEFETTGPLRCSSPRRRWSRVHRVTTTVSCSSRSCPARASCWKGQLPSGSRAKGPLAADRSGEAADRGGELPCAAGDLPGLLQRPAEQAVMRVDRERAADDRSQTRPFVMTSRERETTRFASPRPAGFDQGSCCRCSPARAW